MLTESPVAAEQLDAKWADIQSKGYAIAPFLSQPEMDALLELHHSTTPVVPSDYYPSGFGRSETRRRIFNGIMEIIGPRVEELTPGYRPLMASFVTKKALSTRGRLALHQDYSLVNHDEHLGLNVWAPLCDVDDRNGCMRMVDYSHRFGHISAMPPNPGAYTSLFGELEAHYLTSVPMAAGMACIFDTRILHATEENVTAQDRTAVFLNLVPVVAKPRLHFWNREVPTQLEVYNIDTEFALKMTPNTYPTQAEREGATFVGMIDYAPVPWTLAELEARIPRAEEQRVFSPPREISSAAEGYPPAPQSEPAAMLTEPAPSVRPPSPKTSWWRNVFSLGSPK
jgi:hypothetical protein